MPWMLLQLAVFTAVVFSEIHYGWGSGGSPTAVGAVALIAAFAVTAIPIAVYDLARRVLARFHRKQGAGQNIRLVTAAHGQVLHPPHAIGSGQKQLR